MELQSKNQRAERLIRDRFPSLTRRQVEEAFTQRLVTAKDGGALSKGSKVSDLDCARLETHLEGLRKGNEALTVTVIHETHDFLVVDKPAGMPGHPLSLFDTETVTSWAFARYPELREKFREIQPTFTPHRLDTATSGLLVVARSPEAFQAWRDNFEKKRVEKQYLAWCWGKPREKVFDINYSIAHHKSDSSRMVIPSKGGDYTDPVMEAQSLVKVEAVYPEKFLVRVICHSGVTHQVRVHLASVGFPLLGDELYDPQFSSRPLRPEHHQLRAVRLIYSDSQFQADESAFRQAFT